MRHNLIHYHLSPRTILITLNSNGYLSFDLSAALLDFLFNLDVYFLDILNFFFKHLKQLALIANYPFLIPDLRWCAATQTFDVILSRLEVFASHKEHLEGGIVVLLGLQFHDGLSRTIEALLMQLIAEDS